MPEDAPVMNSFKKLSVLDAGARLDLGLVGTFAASLLDQLVNDLGKATCAPGESGRCQVFAVDDDGRDAANIHGLHHFVRFSQFVLHFI